jgi:hypothetical protein
VLAPKPKAISTYSAYYVKVIIAGVSLYEIFDGRTPFTLSH